MGRAMWNIFKNYENEKTLKRSDKKQDEKHIPKRTEKVEEKEYKAPDSVLSNISKGKSILSREPVKTYQPELSCRWIEEVDSRGKRKVKAIVFHVHDEYSEIEKRLLEKKSGKTQGLLKETSSSELLKEINFTEWWQRKVREQKREEGQVKLRSSNTNDSLSLSDDELSSSSSDSDSCMITDPPVTKFTVLNEDSETDSVDRRLIDRKHERKGDHKIHLKSKDKSKRLKNVIHQTRNERLKLETTMDTQSSGQQLNKMKEENIIKDNDNTSLRSDSQSKEIGVIECPKCQQEKEQRDKYGNSSNIEVQSKCPHQTVKQKSQKIHAESQQELCAPNYEETDTDKEINSKDQRTIKTENLKTMRQEMTNNTNEASSSQDNGSRNTLNTVDESSSCQEVFKQNSSEVESWTPLRRNIADAGESRQSSILVIDSRKSSLFKDTSKVSWSDLLPTNDISEEEKKKFRKYPKGKYPEVTSDQENCIEDEHESDDEDEQVNVKNKTQS